MSLAYEHPISKNTKLCKPIATYILRNLLYLLSLVEIDASLKDFCLLNIQIINLVGIKMDQLLPN